MTKDSHNEWNWIKIKIPQRINKTIKNINNQFSVTDFSGSWASNVRNKNKFLIVIYPIQSIHSYH